MFLFILFIGFILIMQVDNYGLIIEYEGSEYQHSKICLTAKVDITTEAHIEGVCC